MMSPVLNVLYDVERSQFSGRGADTLLLLAPGTESELLLKVHFYKNSI